MKLPLKHAACAPERFTDQHEGAITITNVCTATSVVAMLFPE